jgi:hypothetical protein
MVTVTLAPEADAVGVPEIVAVVVVPLMLSPYAAKAGADQL